MGGLLTDAWLGKPEPRSKADLPTPSLGKYYNMIRQWGSWVTYTSVFSFFFFFFFVCVLAKYFSVQSVAF